MSKVTDIIIDKFLKDVEEKQSMPWQRPYEMYNAFNYFTLTSYRGINRLMLPFGEYITAHQINEYNNANGKNYRFAKGIKWHPVIFFKKDEKKISHEELKERFPDAPDSVTENTYVGSEDGWNYVVKADGTCFKTRNVLKYYNVADRKFFVDENGNCLPSKLETREVEITLSNPKEVMQGYINRSGVRVMDTIEVPSYAPVLDTVYLNKHIKSEKEWFSTAFHELGHSTGHHSRLARKFAANVKSDDYAKEECVAEICASLCCAECGIYELNTSLSREYENNLAYVQYWKRHIKDWGKEFIYIVSQADKAFNLIMDMDI